MKEDCKFKIPDDPEEADYGKGEYVFENYLARQAQQNVAESYDSEPILVKGISY